MIELFVGKHRVVSIIGMAKNAGKTVALNHLIEELGDAEIPVALTSIGRDGETVDLVTQTDKPRVYVPRGTLIATAEQLFNLGETRMEVLEVTRHRTPMGKVMIARALADGFVQIGGPSTSSEIRDVSERMLALGAQVVLIDGALDRLSSASQLVSDACILSTGASVNRYMNTTLQRTAQLAEIFKLPQTEDDWVRRAWIEAAEPMLVELRANPDGSGEGKELGTRPLGIRTMIGEGIRVATQVDENSRYLIVKGSLVAETLRRFVESTPHFRSIEWVIGDATDLFVDETTWKYLKRVGVRLSVVHPIRLLAITVNPTSPSGHSYDSALFRSKLQEMVGETPVIDVFDT
ncbi:MAG: hypothetical protein Q4A52_01275 [Bacillota bacterium]|nr:hypothetical protein [Bacillota bacterium]